ncbi:MAG: DinB family protein [Bacteroidota bacterium]
MKLLLPLLSLLLMGLPTSAQEDSAAFPARAEWHEKWKNSQAYITEALEKLPDSSFQYRPAEGQMSVQEQVQHISGTVYGLSRRFLGYQPADFNEEKLRELLSAEYLSRPQLMQLLKDAYAFGTDAINSLEEEEWDEMVPNFFAGPRSKRVIIYLLQDHATHHRAQVLMYLRLLGYEAPRYRGW